MEKILLNQETEASITKAKDVNQITWEYLRLYWYVFLPLLIGGIATLKIGWLHSNEKLLNIGVITLCAEIFVLIIGYIYARQQAKKYFTKRLAVSMGCSFTDFKVVDSSSTILFKFGINKRLSIPTSWKKNIFNILSGNFINFPFRFYNYQTMISENRMMGSGEIGFMTINFTVLEITYTQNLPPIFINNRWSFFYPERDLLDSKEIILQPEVNRYQKIYSKDDLSSTLRDSLGKILDELSRIDKRILIEFSENKIYIIKDKIITKKKDLISFFKVADFIINNL